MNILEQIKETTAHIQKHTKDFTPDYGIILGTGLGGLVNEIEIEYSLEYASIPHFPVSTVESHSGKLLFGTLGGKKIVAMSGRFHYYEGYTMQQVTFPVRVMKYLGVKKLFISNASGGTNPKQRVGELLIINDHVNFQPEHPLRGKNYEELGPRFPSLHDVYDKALIAKAVAIANANNIAHHTGVYGSVPGPCLETPAEYRMYHILGVDCVGMSTVPEVLVANHMGLTVFAISVITDVGILDVPIEVSLDDVVKAAKEAEPKLTLIIKTLIAED